MGTEPLLKTNIRQLKLLSVLIKYPEQELFDALPVLNEAVESIVDTNVRGKCSAFLNYLKTASLLQLQEQYSTAFDFNPATCLNLTYHRWGDGKERGSAMADMEELYRRSGYARTIEELPDYLPLILEFLSMCPDAPGISILQNYGSDVRTIAYRLGKSNHPYADLFEIVADFLSKPMTSGTEIKEIA
jgi:nitrate reductase delta subunit